MPGGTHHAGRGTAAVQLAAGTSRALFGSSPVVLLAAEDDEAGLAEAAARATELGVPVLLTPPGATAPDAATEEEIVRLGADRMVRFGRAATAPTATPAGDGNVADVDAAVAVTRAAPLDGLLVLAIDGPTSRAAVATARASRRPGPRPARPRPADRDDAIKALAGQPVDRILAIGDAFGPADLVRRRVDTAATGVVLPGGGQVVFPGRRLVALYGHPGSRTLGSLGEQPVDAAIARARAVAASYQALVERAGGPAFEIIATVASAGAGADGDYSREASIEHLRPWVDAAGAAGVYVMLDLQPGRTDFLTQAKLYAELLAQPHVGLALDPEWRLAPDQCPHATDRVGQRGRGQRVRRRGWPSSPASHRLPQKVLMLHQFRLDMITERSTLDTTHDELRIVIHADGFGSAGQKHNTWRHVAGQRSARCVVGLEELLRRGPPHLHPRPDGGGRSVARLRLLPVGMRRCGRPESPPGGSWSAGGSSCLTAHCGSGPPSDSTCRLMASFPVRSSSTPRRRRPPVARPAGRWPGSGGAGGTRWWTRPARIVIRPNRCRSRPTTRRTRSAWPADRP